LRWNKPNLAFLSYGGRKVVLSFGGRKVAFSSASFASLFEILLQAALRFQRA
jgi:hypothetical protein